MNFERDHAGLSPRQVMAIDNFARIDVPKVKAGKNISRSVCGYVRGFPHEVGPDGLTRNERTTLNFIRDWQEAKGETPRVRDMILFCGAEAYETETYHYILRRLREKGYIQRHIKAGGPSGIKIIGGGDD